LERGFYGEADDDQDRKRFLVDHTKPGFHTRMCPLCAADMEMIAPENTRVISTLEQPALEQWLNAGQLHRSQAANGSVLICLDSLLARVQNTEIS
jgi:hypothetical protein